MKKNKDQHVTNENTEEQMVDQAFASDNMTGESTRNSASEVAEWQDKYIRLSAEFDNYRKRTLKEKMELIQNGGADVIKAILSTADDFDRALAVMKEGPDREGMSLIYTNFMNTLISKGVKEIESFGKEFDVDFHEAVAKVPANEQFSQGMVVDVIQKGYMLKDTVIRFAKVVVAE